MTTTPRNDQTTDEPTNDETPGSPAGPDSWVAQAIAEQEEYIKRWRSCQDTLGLAHSWDRFAGAPGVTYQACWRCRVTRTREDYQAKTGTSAISRR